MMQRASLIQNGRDVPIFKVPMLRDRATQAVVTELSSYRLSLFTEVDRASGGVGRVPVLGSSVNSVLGHARQGALPLLPPITSAVG